MGTNGNDCEAALNYNTFRSHLTLFSQQLSSKTQISEKRCFCL